MATELGLLSLTHLHKLSQSQDSKNQNQDQECQLNPNTLSKNPTPTSTSTIATNTTISTTSDTSASWMWNPKGHQEADEDSWEVRAFAEDTGNVMGTTWPPRSYTCAFCRREFRSAQALGGHMNVHRRDRARLHQVLPPNSIISHPAAAPSASSNPAAAASSFLIPTREFVASGSGLCLLYQLPNPTNSSSATAAAAFGSSASFAACTTESASPSPSTLLSISPYPPGSLVSPLNFPGRGDGSGRWSRRDRRPSRPEGQLESPDSGGGDETELDLELRLGHGPTPS